MQNNKHSNAAFKNMVLNKVRWEWIRVICSLRWPCQNKPMMEVYRLILEYVNKKLRSISIRLKVDLF